MVLTSYDRYKMIYIEKNNNILDINMYYTSIYDLLNYIIKNYHNLPNKIFFDKDICKSDIKNQKNIIKIEDHKFILFFEKYIEKNDFIDYNNFYTFKKTIMIKKNHILTRSLDYYKKLQDLYFTSEPDILEEYIDKSIFYIFNQHKLEILKNTDYVIVGAGLSGVVFADLLSETNKNILIIEKRDHIAGNCYDYIDKDTNIRVSKYGAHILHTNSSIVWEYVHKYSKWIPYKHKVYGKIGDQQFPIPININTVNILCNKNIKNETEMIEYLETVRDKSIIDPKNSEEYCLQKFGKELYEKVIKHYTKKQWDKYPDELDVSVLKRIPLRYDFSEGYFSDIHQALPENGYTEFVNNIVNKNNILTIFNTDYFEYKNKLKNMNIIKTIYTGPIDYFFKSLGYDKLEYRSINFNFIKIKNIDYYQNNSVINYPSNDFEFTRIVEYKHFYPTNSNYTIISKEFSTDYGDPYYPVPNKQNIELYEKYKKLSECEKDIIFCGRLASYKYFNMDEAILNSINMCTEYLTKI